MNLAGTLQLCGDIHGARALDEEVLRVAAQTSKENEIEVQQTRGNLASMMYELGEIDAARSLDESVLEAFERSLPDSHPLLRSARRNLAIGIARSAAAGGARSGDPERFAELLHALARSLRQSAATAIGDASSREAEERVASCEEDLGRVLACAQGLRVFPVDAAWMRDAFITVESMRGVASAWAQLARSTRDDAECEALRARARRASASMAAMSRAGGPAKEIERAHPCHGVQSTVSAFDVLSVAGVQNETALRYAAW